MASPRALEDRQRHPVSVAERGVEGSARVERRDEPVRRLRRGVLLGEGAAFNSSAGNSSSSGGPVTVVVEGTSISVTISGNGTWEIDDFIPAGTFTLIFFQDGVEIGRVEITAGDGVKVNVVVKMDDGFIVVVKLELDGGDDDGDDDGNDRKVTICHIPPGNPDNAKTHTIDESALSAHLAHGDKEGPCP